MVDGWRWCSWWSDVGEIEKIVLFVWHNMGYSLPKRMVHFALGVIV